MSDTQDTPITPIDRAMLSLSILSGGRSSRMGQDKGLMIFRGKPLIQHCLTGLENLSDDVTIITNQPEDYVFAHIPRYKDILPGFGPLGGIHTAMTWAKHPLLAVIACDMPFASLPLFQAVFDRINVSGADVVIPSSLNGLEPLHAIYRVAACLPVIQKYINAGQKKVIGWLPEVNLQVISPEETSSYTPQHLAFININTPDDSSRYG